MTPWLRYLVPALAVALIATGIIVGQHCSYERQLAQQQATSTKADTQLIETTQQLATERVQQAQTKAIVKRAAVAQQVHAEVQRETGGDSDLVGWINARVGGD